MGERGQEGMRRGLSAKAVEPLAPGEEYEPYTPAGESAAEFTLKAVLTGALCGVLFGAANAYLGLRAGLTISTSIPIAVMTVALFRALKPFGLRAHILESNMSQTVGSASSSVASGVIFTLPALFLWGLSPGLLQMTLLALCGGILGTLFMVPLRRYLIAREHGYLPYPEGTACAEVLVAADVGGARAKNVFLGLGVGAAFKFFTGWSRLIPSEVSSRIPFLKKGELGAEVSAALFGVGYILGPRIATIMVGGGLLSWLVLIPAIAWWGEGRLDPLYPETVKTIAQMSPSELWSRYVRYIGAGAVATGGLITLVRSIPTMVESFKVGLGQIRRRLGGAVDDAPRTDRDLSLKTLGIGAGVVVLVMALVPAVFGDLESLGQRVVAAVAVTICAFFFVTVSSRIVGLVGVTSNPTSGMTIATLLATAGVFLVAGWTDLVGKAAALTVGCVVAIAASVAGDMSQDLKTGFLLGATPRRQQNGELIGVLTSATFVCLTVIMLAGAYGFGSAELPAPQATLMKLVIDGVLDRSLPWVFVLIGVGVAVIAELCRVPSLPFAVGVYLPVSTMMAVFFGGALRWWLERSAGSAEEVDSRRERGVLFGSGLVGGEGLLGVGIAAAAAWAVRQGRTPWSLSPEWAGRLEPLVGVAALALLVWLFARLAGRRQSP